MFPLPRPDPRRGGPAPAAPPHLLHQHIQELEARLAEYRRRVASDRRTRDQWIAVVRRAALLVAGPELNAQVAAHADWPQTAGPDDWLDLIRAGHARGQQSRAPAGPAASPALVPEVPGAPHPAPAPALPPLKAPVKPPPAGLPPEPSPAGPAPPEPPPAARPQSARSGEAEPSPLPAVLPRPWWWPWTGQGTVKDNRHHLTRYILDRLPSTAPAAPWSWPAADQTQRILMLLLLMAETGQVLQRALQVSLLRIAQTADPWKTTDHLQRDAEFLVRQDCVEARTVAVATGKTRATVKLLRLTARGRQWLADLGRPPVEDDWTRLERLHGGEAQQTHTYGVLYASSTLRLWGWEVQVVPAVDGPAAPDLEARHGDRSPWPGEVERGAGSADRRQAKWRHLAALAAERPRLLLIGGNARRLLGLLQEVRAAVPDMEVLAGHLGGLYLPRRWNAPERPPLVHLRPADALAADRLVAAPVAPPGVSAGPAAPA